jgi:hypothetical protein
VSDTITQLVSVTATPETGGQQFRLVLIQAPYLKGALAHLRDPDVVHLQVRIAAAMSGSDTTWQTIQRLGKDLGRFGVDVRSPNVIVLDEKLAMKQLVQQLNQRGKQVSGEPAADKQPPISPTTFHVFSPDLAAMRTEYPRRVDVAKLPRVLMKRDQAVELARTFALYSSYTNPFGPADLPTTAADAANWSPPEWVIAAIIEASR